jgi:hypothetical protein
MDYTGCHQLKRVLTHNNNVVKSANSRVSDWLLVHEPTGSHTLHRVLRVQNNAVTRANPNLRLSALGAAVGLVGAERAAAAAARRGFTEDAMAALRGARMSPSAWHKAGVAAAPVARHGRPLSAADILITNGVEPVDVVDGRGVSLASSRRPVAVITPQLLISLLVLHWRATTLSTAM